MTDLIKPTNQHVAAMSRLFSSSILNDFARKGSSSLFERLMLQLLGHNKFSLDMRVGEVFDVAFQYIKGKEFRQEYVYKSAIAHKVLLGRHSLNTAVMLNELRAGDRKADSVILNGTSSVYEIKTERDTLARLNGQIEAYRRVFARVNVICGEKHCDAIVSSVPSDVGVFTLSSRYQISTVREAIELPSRTEPVAIFDAIRLEEAKKILQLYDIDIPDLPNTQMSSALRDMFNGLSACEAHSGMVTILKQTRDQSRLSSLLQSLPASLTCLALSTSVRKQDYSRLVDSVNQSVDQAIKWN